jgi:dihydrodipicolinate synthase/N-acetylneuraminate lyase
MEAVDGRLPVVFGCSGISIPQVLLFARAGQKAGADSIIAMAPARADQAGAKEMFRRMAEVFDGPIMVQNADNYAPLTGEEVAALVDEIPQIQYLKEERNPGPKHIAEVAGLVSDQVKCIFGGAAGKFLPDEMSRGANGSMPACELADVLVKVTELWWQGQEAEARALHRCLLPLLNLESHPFMRYILKRRGVFSTLVERAPAGKLALDEGDKREIDTLLQAIAGQIDSFPILPE